jgi:beta-phosphoglucomutase-like phosphatase (HAD superfamily)
MGASLQAVLFDMDGTLLDSEKIWDVALDDLAESLGGQLSTTGRTRMVGTPLGRSIAILHDDLGIEADAEASGAYLLSRAAELFARPLPWRPGARELLDAVAAAGLPAGCDLHPPRAHQTRAANARRGPLRRRGVRRRRPAAKPAPDPYLLAAAQLRVTPEHCRGHRGLTRRAALSSGRGLRGACRAQ